MIVCAEVLRFVLPLSLCSTVTKKGIQIVSAARDDIQFLIYTGIAPITI